MKRYTPKDIESKWQRKWEEDGIYRVDFDSSKPKFVGFGMFNYPSGAGIHVGHVRNFTIPDVITRVKRQQGFESYQPVGWDSFGLPAENYAIKTGVSPQESTKSAIGKYHDQYRAMGWAVDWSKEVNTTDPNYYKWTQWCFLKLLENSLAYQEESAQWWCDQCKTVLADEQVIGGKCWRHDSNDDPVVNKRKLKQWFFKITDYADEILDHTDDLDWTESVKSSQKAWIGKSVGAEVIFQIDSLSESLKVFTTRPDTLFGATFMVIAPEHPLIEKLVTDEKRQEVTEYVSKAMQKTEVQRQQDADKDKTGVFSGSYAINPINDEKIPIWIADYVLMGYGTGAIMAVPAHDERDFEFAKKFDLPIKQVVAPYIKFQGANQARNDVETLNRTVADAIIKNEKNQYLLLVEEDNTHFVGGGVEPEDEDMFESVRREVAEEVGYTDIDLITKASCEIVSFGYRITKNKNQHTKGAFYEVKLKSDKQLSSEIEEGKHKIIWVDKDKVSDLITWESHAFAWRQYLNASTCYDGEGILVNSGTYDSMESSEAREKIVADLQKNGLAEEKVNYRMRDWLISRQRYWGAPIPVIHCQDCGVVPVAEDELPVVLPEIDNYKPTGGNVSVLAGVDEWVNVDCPKCAKPAKRETDTMDGYVCSSWYFLRYLDPTNIQEPWSKERVGKWMPIDCYNGGDHATAHLLYARFFTRFFHKIGLLSHPEPFKKMIFNGKIKASDGSAFSKSKGNGIDPLEVIEQGYGADAIRLYEMFAAPVEFDVLWDMQGIPGSHRFLNRVWNLSWEYIDSEEGQSDIASGVKKTHQTIKRFTQEVEDNRFNTAIASLMELTNYLYKSKETEPIKKNQNWKFAIESLLMMLAPFAPHITEELWQQIGYQKSIHVDNWPIFDESMIGQESLNIAVQVNGKVRAQITINPSDSEESVLEMAKSNPKIAGYLEGKELIKEIYVRGRLVSLVVS